VIRTNSTPM